MSSVAAVPQSPAALSQAGCATATTLQAPAVQAPQSWPPACSWLERTSRCAGVAATFCAVCASREG
eukprot:351706-Chlamydomonas_euryale.AAC.1